MLKNWSLWTDSNCSVPAQNVSDQSAGGWVLDRESNWDPAELDNGKCKNEIETLDKKSGLPIVLVHGTRWNSRRVCSVNRA